MKTFWHSLIVAILGGAIATVSQAVTSGQPLTGRNVGGAAIAGALVGVGALLRSSPLDKKE